jgi:hypothetical protein
MSGGNKKMVQNTRERWTSDTFNRESSLQEYTRAEVLRRLMNMRVTTDSAMVGGSLESGSYIDTDAADVAAHTLPLRADIYEGLVVLPQAGTLNLYVSAGIIGIDDPDGEAGSSRATAPNPDDSRYKIVVDPGIHTNGVLVIGAGGGGATRIDLIECRRASTQTALEQQSVDIYDTTTGLFAASLEDKVVTDRLTYRVRAGVAGGGIPSAAPGWLPICVAAVPSTATTVNDMTFWDVRPLVKDRVNAPLDSSRIMGETFPRIILADDNTFPGETRVSGFSEGVIGMYRAGGALIVPPLGYVDVRAAANQATGYVAAAGDLWYLFAVFPMTADGKILPRWCEYNAHPNPRVPLGPLGLMVVTSGTNGPSSAFNFAFTTNVQAPAATGLLISGPGVLLASGYHDATPAARGFICNGANMFYASQNGGGPTLVPTATTTQRDDYTLVQNVHYPRAARSIVVLFSATFTTAGPNANIYWDSIPQVRDPGGAGYSFAGRLPGAALGHSGITGPIGASIANQLIVQTNIEIPLIADGFSAGLASNDLHLRMNWNPLGVTARTGSAAIVGWRL